MKIVSCFAGLWKVSESRYTEMLAAVAAGEYHNLARIGTRLGDIDLDVTDLSAEAASVLLAARQNAKAIREQTARIHAADLLNARIAHARAADRCDAARDARRASKAGA